MTKKKTVTITIIVASVLLVGYLVVAVIVPRVMLHNLIKENLSDIGDGAEYFTEYSVAHTEATFSADNGYIAVDIPKVYKKQDEFSISQLYRKNDTNSISILEYDDFSEFNLLDPRNYENYDFEVEIGIKEFVSGVEGFGNGLPDSAYGTYKCIYMMDEEDYNPFNFNNQVAYYAMGVLKTIVGTWGDVTVYENDNICGFVHVSERTYIEEGAKYFGLLEIYSKDNLNELTTIMIHTDNLQEIYAIMNSARPAV